MHDNRVLTVAELVQHPPVLAGGCKLVGIDHVALGSDYDGAITARFDTSQLIQVTQALLDEGFSEAEIRQAMGLNALRVLRAGIAPL